LLHARNGTSEIHVVDGAVAAFTTGPAVGVGDGGVIELITVTGNAPILTDGKRRYFEKINAIHWKSGAVEAET